MDVKSADRRKPLNFALKTRFEAKVQLFPNFVKAERSTTKGDRKVAKNDEFDEEFDLQDVEVWRAEQWLDSKLHKIRTIRESDCNAQQKARNYVIIAAQVVRRMKRNEDCRKAFDGIAATSKHPERFIVKKGASPHLPVLRFLGLAKHPASALRYADGVDACLRQGGSWKKIRKFVLKHGVAKLCRKGRGQ